MQKIYVLLFLTFTCVLAYAQTPDNSDASIPDSLNEQLISSLEAEDISFLWTGDRSQNERLGFIGDDYQRLEVRFLSVIQNYDNPFEYFVYGKTRVESVICEFQGSFLITETGFTEDPVNGSFMRAYLSGNYAFFEDHACHHSGIFRGSFSTAFFIDKEGDFYYDDLDAESDYFNNNEFWGEWYQYYSDTILVANWGDYRIPESGDLDVGKESFRPSFKYIENGWKGFLEEKEKDDEEEREKWWEK